MQAKVSRSLSQPAAVTPHMTRDVAQHSLMSKQGALDPGSPLRFAREDIIDLKVAGRVASSLSGACLPQRNAVPSCQRLGLLERSSACHR